MALGRIIFFATVAVGSAANCAAGDETSLLQTVQSVQQGSERIPNEAAGWPTPVHDLNAITDSTPDTLDAGSVMGAFTNNKGQVEEAIEDEAAKRIEFTSKQRAERKADYQKASDAVTNDHKAVEAAKAADKAAVAATKKARKEIVDKAAAQVKEAKYAAEAHAIKAKQADAAAALGRKVGTIEAQDAAHHAWEDYASEVKKEHEAAALKVTKEKIAAKTAAAEAAVKKQTAAMKAADESWVARAHRAATVAKAKAAAAAAKAEMEIEGAEGLKNKMTDVKANWATLHYDRERAASQADIDADAAGSIGIDQSWIDTNAAGPAMGVPSGEEFAAPDGLATTAFQKALAGAEE